MKDMQKQKCYDAERRAFGWTDPTEEWADVVAFANKVMTSAYTVRKYGAKKIEVRSIRGRAAHASAGGQYLSMERGWYSKAAYIGISHNSQRRWVVVHELAHHYAGMAAGHGWKFCSIYLDLVRHFLGKEAHDRLRAEFKAGKVRYTAPRKRNLTEAQRQALRERMIAVRAAKNPVTPTLREAS